MNSTLIAGIDEAGRGPLAGDVYAAAVILSPDHDIAGLADSKQLSEKKRLLLDEKIKQQAIAWAIASASVQEIDRINILQAALLAMQRALEALSVTPQWILVDGLYLPHTHIPGQAVVKGDALHACISAASILAKVARDQALDQLDQEYPAYGFASHKGYPTRQHLDNIARYGVLPVHRKTFAPVKKLLQPA